ncbi:MAG TPA: hypothetical protein VFH24_06210, partial [Gemmatimonadales bacterium]|nr:hypothetical protein [Gemmatimonadales bacterium]
FALAALSGCGGRRPPPATEVGNAPAVPRTLPMASLFQLETGGPPPGDTSVTFVSGTPRVVVLYHAGESIVFARLSFEAGAFGDSGQTVEVSVRPRPGIYGFDFTTSLPFRPGQAAATFAYGRYFSAPARARQVYGSDVAFERALSVGQLLTDGQVSLLSTDRPAPDNVHAPLPTAGSYVVAAPR